MEKYILYSNTSSTSKEYISTIYRNSKSTTADMGDAIEFSKKETAILMKEYLNEREGTLKYKVMCIKTSIEEEVN